MRHFAHILNLVSEQENKALHESQQLPLASIHKAIETCNNKIKVDLLYTHNSKFPLYHTQSALTIPLERNINSLDHMKSPRELPFLRDILEKGYNATTAEYLIYSNSDIGLMPQFYKVIEEYINKGHDAIVVNRRRIKSTLNNSGDLDAIYSEVGLPHPGYDMFIFKRELFPDFILNNICIGIPFAGNDLFYNLFCFAEKPVLLADKHLTFHIGLELVKDWGSSAIQKHNYREFRKTTKALLPHMDITKFPGAGLPFFKRHLKWLMNPTISYPEMFITDLKQLNKPRVKPIYDPNYKKQSYYEWLMNYIGLD